MAIKIDPYVRFLRTPVKRHGECLIWQGKPNNSGYGSINVGGKIHGAHRFVYTKWHGEIPGGFHIDHQCHNETAIRGECDGSINCPHRRCVNPAHLRAVTPLENRNASPLFGARAGEWQRARTHCPRGHEYSASNTYIQPDGGRSCRTCGRERTRERKVAANPLHGLGANALKTHCPRGHEYSEENTLLRRGSRECRTCIRDKARERRGLLPR